MAPSRTPGSARSWNAGWKVGRRAGRAERTVEVQAVVDAAWKLLDDREEGDPRSSLEIALGDALAALEES